MAPAGMAPATSSSSSTALLVPDRKRAAEIPSEDLNDSMDIMSLHVGAAYGPGEYFGNLLSPSDCAPG